MISSTKKQNSSEESGLLAETRGNAQSSRGYQATKSDCSLGENETFTEGFKQRIMESRFVITLSEIDRKRLSVGLVFFSLLSAGALLFSTSLVGVDLDRTSAQLISIQSTKRTYPVIIGTDFTGAFSTNDLLKGFKTNTAPSEIAFRPHVFSCVEEYRPFPLNIVESTKVTSKEELDDVMDISGEMKVSYGPVSGSGGGQFVKKTVSSKHKVIFFYRQIRASFSQECKKRTMTPVHDVSTLNKKNPNEIFDKYGTKFINQLIYGMQLNVKIKISSESELDSEYIFAELQGGIANGVLEGAFQGKFDKNKTSKKERYNFEAKIVGLGADIEDVITDFDKVLEVIKEFNKDYSDRYSYIDEHGPDTGSVTKQMTPIRFGLGEIGPNLPDVSLSDLLALDRKMTELSTTWEDTLFTKALLDNEDDDIKEANPRGKPLKTIYYPWLKEKKKLTAFIQQTYNECVNFRYYNITETLKTPVPELSPENLMAIHGLLGEEYVPAPVTIGRTTYSEMYWEGYTINDKPFYKGKLFCDYDDRKVVGPELIKVIERNVKTTACSPSASPIKQPTKSPTKTPVKKPTPVTRPTPYVPSWPTFPTVPCIGIGPGCGHDDLFIP